MAAYDSLHSLLDYECLLFTVTNAERWIPCEWILLNVLTCPPIITSGEPNRDHRLEQLVVILLYSLQRKCMIESRCLANGLPLVLCYSGFHAVLTKPLPRNGHIRCSIF
jgi:hypothetical protein